MTSHEPQLLICACVCSLITLSALADSPSPPSGQSDARPWWILGQVEYVSAYYYRGFFQEDHGPIVQPAMKLGYDAYRGEGWLNRVSPVVGLRASLHHNDTFATEDPEWVYELDLLGGMQFALFERVNVEALFVTIRSPNGAFDTIEEFDLNLQFDDTGLWSDDLGAHNSSEAPRPPGPLGGFAIKPFANFKVELSGSAAGGDEGALVELGIEPEFGLIQSQSFPLRISFPILVALSLDDYYFLPGFGPFPAVEDQTFGYVKAGVTFLLPITFIPADYGRWAVTAGVDYIYLGENLKLFNEGKESDVIGRFGFLVAY